MMCRPWAIRSQAARGVAGRAVPSLLSSVRGHNCELSVPNDCECVLINCVSL